MIETNINHRKNNNVFTKLSSQKTHIQWHSFQSNLIWHGIFPLNIYVLRYVTFKEYIKLIVEMFLNAIGYT